MSVRGNWNSRLGFIFAATGSAVGLGNIWKFPYVTGEYGGGAFVLFYLFAVVVVGLPIMVAELVLGWRSQKNPVGAVVDLGHRKWAFVGLLGVLSGLIILSFYSVVAGWGLSYLWMSIRGTFWNIQQNEISGLFGTLYANGLLSSFWHIIFMGCTVYIVLGGVQKGIEKWSRILLPCLFILMFILLGFSITGGGGKEAFLFLFQPKFENLTGEGMLEAIGQSFFTLSLGMGAMITYGSYLKRSDNVIGASATIASLDTLIALVAGMVIFPIVFRFGQEPAQSVGLVFKTLPYLFAQMPFGQIFAISFFLLLAFAALTSAISLLEVVVASLSDELKLSRKKATLIAGLVIGVLGLLSSFSNLHVPFLDKPWLDFFDELTTNYMLPIGGVLISLFASFIVKPGEVRSAFEMHGYPTILYRAWLYSARFISPALVLLVILAKIGIL